MSNLQVSSTESLLVIDRYGQSVAVTDSKELLQAFYQLKGGLRLFYLGREEETISYLKELIFRRPELRKLLLVYQNEEVHFQRAL